MRSVRRLLLCSIVLISSFAIRAPAEEPSLWPRQRELVAQWLIDLTHAFAPGIPHWPGFPDEKRQTIYTHDE